jgi:hypothetical protein
MTPQVALETLADALVKLRTRAADLSRAAFADRSGKTAARLSTAMPRLEEAEQNIKAARGGDLDAGEQARRTLTDFEALLAEIEAEQAWPELGRKIEETFAMAVSWVAGYGNEAERSTLNNTYQACKRAFVAGMPTRSSDSAPSSSGWGWQRISATQAHGSGNSSVAPRALEKARMSGAPPSSLPRDGKRCGSATARPSSRPYASYGVLLRWIMTSRSLVTAPG